MCYPQINCYQAQAVCQLQNKSFTFYLLSKGGNAGQPNLSPWVNSFAVYCSSSEQLDFYFWLAHSLWQAGRFKPLLRGSVIPFISISETRQLLTESATSIYPHWQ